MSGVSLPPKMVTSARDGQRRLAAALWWTMLVSSIAVAMYGSFYFLARPSDDHFSRFILPLRLHIAGGMGALLSGPWQFSEKLRARAINRHRWIGRFYLLSVGIGSIAGLVMSLISKEGTPTHWGFGILAVLWFFTGLQGYLAVRRGDIPAHRRWMIRNFALTLAAVTLRNYLPLMLFGLHWAFRTTYVVVSWLCWVPNLLVAEWMVQRSRRSPAMTAPDPGVGG